MSYQPPPYLVAHRGLSACYPENTLAALDAAIQYTPYIEVDVQLTADHQLVLFHDRTTEQLLGIPGAISDYHLEEMLNHQVKAPLNSSKAAMIASAEQLADWIRKNPKCHLYIEAKRISIETFSVEVMYQQIKEVFQTVSNQCTIISYHLPFIHHVQQDNQFQTGWILENWADRENISQFPSLDVIFADIDYIPSDYHHVAQTTPWVIFEVATPAQANKLYAQGFRWFESFDCAKARHWVKDD